MELTEAQFSAVQVKIDGLLRASKRGTPEREAADKINADWEAANALPQATWQQRKDRREAIAAVAQKHGLI